ncbi:MAG TPA: DUF1549 domain-containing protein [Thermoanaerobaculia bacterium]|nr:DUF1549 domain-containing protein [Thermoanaerobaculia bacterium]
MRLPTRCAAALLSALFLLAATPSSEPVADCAYSPEKARTPKEMWRDASRRAELVAPTGAVSTDAVSSGRRHSARPPVAAPQTFVAKNFIDTEIFGKMQRDGVRWTSPSSDAEFLRRVSLDLTGQIPDSDTVRSFLADTDTNKREKLIDTLLASEGYADKWTMWFGDLVQNVQTSAATIEYFQGRNAYHQFIRSSIASGKPYDQMVRELIAGSGKSFTEGQANYWVRQIQNNGPAQDTYDNLSAASAERFLGLPLNCLSCHSGPQHLELVNSALAKRSRMDFWKNAAFFAQVTVTRGDVAGTNNREYIVADNTTGLYRLNTNSGNKTARAPSSGQPNFVDPAFFLSGETPQSGETRRQAYGRILTAHPQFARATVNYVWKAVFGIGIVEPADSFDLLRQDPENLAPGATVQPTHPQLLTRLAESFVASGHNLRALLRTITVSNAYQLSSRYTPGEWNENWAPYYARHYPRRLMAEEVVDAIIKATGVVGNFTANGFAAPVPRAMMLPDPTEGGSFRVFLNNFGRGDRDEDARASDSSVVQALTLLNDRIVTDRIRATAAGSNVQKLRATNDVNAIVDGLYVATLARYPSAAERQTATTYLRSGDLSRKTEDLQYALINKIEFLFN